MKRLTEQRDRLTTMLHIAKKYKATMTLHLRGKKRGAKTPKEKKSNLIAGIEEFINLLETIQDDHVIYIWFLWVIFLVRQDPLQRHDNLSVHVQGHAAAISDNLQVLQEGVRVVHVVHN